MNKLFMFYKFKGSVQKFNIESADYNQFVIAINIHVYIFIKKMHHDTCNNIKISMLCDHIAPPSFTQTFT